MHAASEHNPLHGITLEMMLKALVDYYGWEQLGLRINVRCFQDHPSFKSSLKFLRTTPWARTKVERLYLQLPSARLGPPAGSEPDSPGASLEIPSIQT